MTDQNIQNKQAFVVVETKVSPAINTMERISKFYSRVSDAKGFITNKIRQDKYIDKVGDYSIAVFEFKEMYKMEEGV